MPLSEHPPLIKYLKGKIILSYDTWIDVKRKKFHFSEIAALITFPKQDKKVKTVKYETSKSAKSTTKIIYY